MRLKGYQWGELIGIVFLLAATATQIFYLEPLKRQVEWRLAAFAQQQTAQVPMRINFENQLSLLKTLNASPEQIAETEQRRDKAIDKFETADANVANYVMDKESVENYLQIIVLILFGLGSLLAGVGRALEMQAAPEQR